MELQFVTYNIHKAIGNDRRYRPERIVEILRELDADVFALQEVDYDAPRSRNQDLAKIIAEELGYHYSLGLNVKLSQGAYGNATLSKYPIVGTRNMNITWGIKKRRGCLVAQIRLPDDREIVVFNIHLGLAAFERMFQVKRILRSNSLQSLGHLPLVILGDTNDHNHRLTTVLSGAGFHDSAGDVRKGNHTYPSFAPRPIRPLLRLDKVFYNDHWNLADHRVILNERTKLASDHLPLSVRLQIKNGSE